MNKIESVYRILLSFMLIDNVMDEKEKEIIIEFLGTKFGSALPKEMQSINLHKSKLSFENFRSDAKVAIENYTKEELSEILDFIGKMIKSDGDLDAKEIMLFETLLEVWGMDKSVMEKYGIKQGLWSKFFGQ